MRTLVRIFGMLLALLALPFFAISALLLNEKFQGVRVTWGFFDPGINGISVSTTDVMALSGVIGVALVVGGILLARAGRRRAASQVTRRGSRRAV